MSDFCAACLTQPITPQEVAHVLGQVTSQNDLVILIGDDPGHSKIVNMRNRSGSTIRVFAAAPLIDGADVRPDFVDIQTTISFPRSGENIAAARYLVQVYGGTFLMNTTLSEGVAIHKIKGVETGVEKAIENLSPYELSETMRLLLGARQQSWAEIFNILPAIGPRPNPDRPHYNDVAAVARAKLFEVALRRHALIPVFADTL